MPANLPIPDILTVYRVMSRVLPTDGTVLVRLSERKPASTTRTLAA